MISYKEISLIDLIEEIGEQEFLRIVSDFSCSKSGENLNTDIESFIKEKAIIFDRNDISRTYLIFAHTEDKELILVGYYSIAQKPFEFKESVSRKTRKEIAGHQYFLKGPLPALLLGQLGKNFSRNAHYGSLIRGKDMLHYAFLRMKDAYRTLPFKIIYLECKDHPSLREFYESHGFTLHANKEGKPYKREDADLIIYMANSTILEYIKG